MEINANKGIFKENKCFFLAVEQFKRVFWICNFPIFHSHIIQTMQSIKWEKKIEIEKPKSKLNHRFFPFWTNKFLWVCVDIVIGQFWAPRLHISPERFILIIQRMQFQWAHTHTVNQLACQMFVDRYLIHFRKFIYLTTALCLCSCCSLFDIVFVLFFPF